MRKKTSESLLPKFVVTTTVGDPFLAAHWTDPSFDPKQRAYTSPIWYTP